MTSSDRKAAEQNFYDACYKTGELDSLNGFYDQSGGVRFYESRIYHGIEGKKILEYGCGVGAYAARLADRGAVVTGIDISSEAIEQARRRAGDDRGGRLRFTVADAEALEFPDGSFDVVCGTGILHHLDLNRSLAEVKRVLAPGGRAVFYEPIAHNPIVNLYRVLTPSKHTPDEHPLRMRDIEDMRSTFASLQARFFDIFSIAAIPFLRIPGGASLLRLLEGADRVVLRAAPMHRWAATVVLEASR